METQNIEYKPSWRDEYLKVIVAFANKDGGELIVGVDDNGNPIGVKKSKKLLEDIPNKIRNKLGIIPSVKIEKVEDKDIIHESPLKTPSSKLPIFYFKIGQLVEFDHKKDKTKKWTQFLTNLKQVFKKQTVSGLH